MYLSGLPFKDLSPFPKEKIKQESRENEQLLSAYSIQDIILLRAFCKLDIISLSLHTTSFNYIKTKMPKYTEQLLQTCLAEQDEHNRAPSFKKQSCSLVFTYCKCFVLMVQIQKCFKRRKQLD